ncbi:histidine phosphatase family protein [bacterium]|nr:histidine phosphatase family protein [bacterium]MCI0604737.1 histidine phosphatase family protein [bacterium]
MKRITLLIVLFYFLLSGAAFGKQKLTTVLLVRHAEKVVTSGDDPPLSPQGVARAELLVRMFENSGLNAIYTSQFARTRLTGEPLAKRLRISLETVDAGTTNKLVASILSKHSGGTVLVVGHSNTLPEIIEALGGGEVQEIDDSDYDNLYVVTVFGNGIAKVVRTKFFVTGEEQVCK